MTIVRQLITVLSFCDRRGKVSSVTSCDDKTEALKIRLKLFRRITGAPIGVQAHEAADLTKTRAYFFRGSNYFSFVNMTFPFCAYGAKTSSLQTVQHAL